MNNIIRSDLYRIRKGAAVRNTFIGMLLAVLFLAVMLWVGENVILGGTVNGHVAETVGEMMDQSGEEQRSSGVGVVTATTNFSGGAGFVKEMLSQNITAFLLLPLFMAVFANDFASGTYRNTLSFETNRKKVFLSKLALSFLLTMGLLVFMVLCSMLAGGILFGFAGMFTSAFLVETLVSLLLMAPLYLALIAFGHCMTAFTQSTGATIAIYFVALLVYSAVVTAVAMFLPAFEWITLLDFLSGISYLAYYTAIPVWEVVFYLGFGIATSALFTLLGLARYNTADMN